MSMPDFPDPDPTLADDLLSTLWRYGLAGGVVAVRANPDVLEVDFLVFDQDGIKVAYDRDTGAPITDTVRLPLTAHRVR